jgi:hypothetical protein
VIELTGTNGSPAVPGRGGAEPGDGTAQLNGGPVDAEGEPSMVAAGRRLVAAATARGIAVRLLGGVAIWIRSSAAARSALGRQYPDIDLVAHKRQSRELRGLLEEQDLQPERVFNATHGARRLLYHSPEPGSSWHVDVFLDTFEMSHTLDLGAQLEAEAETLPAAELMLTKLQIAEINRKDLSDVAMLLWDHEPADGGGPGRLNLARIAEACGADWGLYTTVTDNLAGCASLLGELVTTAADRARIAARIDAVARALEQAPKTVAWRMRARIGRRIRWFKVPEEVVR